jgi:GrpB-like predicted nucleotidyltransferase (UPF0157 family)
VPERRRGVVAPAPGTTESGRLWRAPNKALHLTVALACARPRAGEVSRDMEADQVEFFDEANGRSKVLAVFESLRAILGGLLPEARVEHIGSTSIPGAITKGDLDLCVQVERSAFQGADHILATRFARNVGSDQTASLSSFVDDSWPVPVGVQLVVLGGDEDFFLLWRDLLRGSPTILEEYNQLKRRWNGQAHEGYRAAKSDFIEEKLGVLRRAGEPDGTR